MRTVVVSSNGQDPVSFRLRELLRAQVDPEGPLTARYEDIERCVMTAEAELFVFTLTPDPERALEALRRLRRSTGGYLLAVGHTLDPKLILRALDHGADHFLDEAELETGLEAVLMKLKSKKDAGPPSGRLVVVLGVSGGSGASTVSVNLSASLAKDHGKCALIDLKPGRGDLAALLDLKASFHLADLCRNVARLDPAMFEKALIAHPCGVHLLASPQTFDSTRLVSAAGVNQVLNLARRQFMHVVADLEDCFHEEQLIALRQASAIVLLSRLDFTSLRNARRILEHLEENGIGRNRVRLAVNRHGQPGELPSSEAEEALDGKLAYFIPDDPRTINSANNTGVPAVLKAPSAKVSTAIIQLARGVLERRRAEAAVPARSSWFS